LTDSFPVRKHFKALLADESCSALARSCGKVFSSLPFSGEGKLLGRDEHQTAEVFRNIPVDKKAKTSQNHRHDGSSMAVVLSGRVCPTRSKRTYDKYCKSFVTKIEKKRAMGCKLLKFYFYIDHNFEGHVKAQFYRQTKTTIHLARR